MNVPTFTIEFLNIMEYMRLCVDKYYLDCTLIMLKYEYVSIFHWKSLLVYMNSQ